MQTDELSGNVRKAKATLLVSDRYITEDGLLYRMATPRQKRLARVKLIVERLCVPTTFRHDIIRFVHDNCGHYVVQSLFCTLSSRFFRNTLFAEAS